MKVGACADFTPTSNSSPLQGEESVVSRARRDFHSKPHPMNKSSLSLRRRLLARLSIPLFAVLILSAVATFFLARYIGSAVYDRWLYDSAMTLAEQVQFTDGKANLNLPKSAIDMFEWDSIDKIYEEVRSLGKASIFRNAIFPEPPSDIVINQARYYDHVINKQPVRIVAVMLPNPNNNKDAVIVQVAETKKKRESLLADIILFTLSSQAIFLLLTGAFIWFAVTSSLRTLDTVAEQLTTYEAHSLNPLKDTETMPSEVKPLVGAINQLIVKLSEAQNVQRRFIANAAHQIRTPLATLRVQTERALREADPSKHVEALSDVFSSVSRLQHVAQQLLVLARSDRSSEDKLQMVPVDLATLAREELVRWVDAALARDIDLGYEGPENNIMIKGEPHLLRELIGNLVDNGIRYGDKGGEVTLGLCVDPSILYVEDNGPGIPMEERSHVLERFYRRPGAGGDGCGLGLAIAHEIVARHGASINIRDAKSRKGTRIEVVFSKN